MTDEDKELCLQPLTNAKKRAFRQWLYSRVERRISKDVYKQETKFEAYKNLVWDAYSYSASWAEKNGDLPIKADFPECFMDMDKDIPNYYAAWFARYCSCHYSDAVDYEKFHFDTANEIELELRRRAKEKREQEERHRRTIEDARKSGKYEIVFEAIENWAVGDSDHDFLTVIELLKERFSNNSQINAFSALCFQLGRAQGIHNERNRRKIKNAIHS